MAMDAVSVDVVALICAVITCIVYVIRLEGKINVLSAIMSNVREDLTNMKRRYEFDGIYTTIEHKRTPAE